MLARAPGFEEALLVVDIDPADAVGRRLRDVAPARARARARRPCRTSPVVPRRRLPLAHDDRIEPFARRAARTSSSRCGSRSSSGCATTCGKNGFSDVVVGVSGGIDSALDRRARGRGARRRARALRLDAVALLVRGDARRRAAARREPRLRLPRAADRADRRGVRRGARAELRGPRARPDRGEPAGADPRRRC